VSRVCLPWSNEAAARARALWREGQSASAIARVLCAEGLHKASRNAVIGWVHRRGLQRASNVHPGQDEKRAARMAARRAAAERRAKERAQRAAERRALKAACVAEAKAREAPELEPLRDDAGKVVAGDALALSAAHCKFPLGDPAEADFAFCARPRCGESPYCEHHRAVAYVPGSAIKPRKQAA
jgi:GcrA cell cycle regulator